MSARLVKLIILIIIGLLCWAFCTSELPHVFLEILRWLGEGLEHIHIR